MNNDKAQKELNPTKLEKFILRLFGSTSIAFVGAAIAAIGVACLYWANSLWKSDDAIWSILVGIIGSFLTVYGLNGIWTGIKVMLKGFDK